MKKIAFLAIIFALVLGFITLPSTEQATAQDELDFEIVMRLSDRGMPIDVAYSPDGQTIAVSSGLSVWLYDENLNDVRALELPEVGELELFEPLGAGELAWSPDGSMLAAGSGYFVSSVRGQYAIVWDVATGDIIHTFGPEEPGIENEAARQVAWNDDGSKLAGFSRLEYFVWDIETGQELIAEPHNIPLFNNFRWVGDELIVDNTREITRTTFDANTGEFLGAVSIINNDRLQKQLSPNQTQEAIIDGVNGVVMIEDVESGEIVQELEIFTTERFLPIFGQWSDDSQYFLAYIRARQPLIMAWNVETGEEVFLSELNSEESIIAIDLSPNNDFIVNSTNSGIVYVWSIETGEVVAEIVASSGTVQDVDFDPTGTRLVTASGFAPRLWDTESGETLGLYRGFESGIIQSAEFSPDGQYLAAGNASIGIAFPSTVIVWDADSREIVTSMPIDSDTEDFGAFEFLSWSPDGTFLAGQRNSNQSGRNGLYIWETENFELTFDIDPQRARIEPVTWSPDSQTLVGGVMALGVPLLLDDGTQTQSALITFDMSIPDIDQQIRTNEFTVDVAWQPNGDLVANAHSGQFNYISFWDIDAAEELFTIENLPARVTAMEWHPDGELLAIAYNLDLVTPIIDIWQVGSGSASLVAQLDGHLSFGIGISDLAWSDDGQQLATAGDDGQIIIYGLAE